MHIHSNKSRRRMHAIPAAIMLLLTVILWLGMGRPLVLAQPLLSAASLSEWQQRCNRCVVEAQFDVLAGEVVRLESRRQLQLSRSVPALPDHPQLQWQWAADESVDGGVLLRLTLHTAQTEQWPARILHYVWDPRFAADTHQALSDFEHLLVVSGDQLRPGEWHRVQRDLNADWQALYAENMPPLRRLELAVGMPGNATVAGGFVQQIELLSGLSALPPPPAIAITE